MPLRPKKKITRRTEAGLTGPELENLLTGCNVLDHEADPFISEQARREAWAKHKAYIMGLQGREAQGETFGLPRGSLYFGLFERPAAWWTYEAGESRRLLRGDPSGALPEHGYIKGVPRMFTTYEAQRAMRYETEAEYLARHGLLNEQERAVLSQKR